MGQGDRVVDDGLLVCDEVVEKSCWAKGTWTRSVDRSLEGVAKVAGRDAKAAAAEMILQR